ncbi:hypothetical protein [Nitrosomonas sp. Is37]|uniref:hypothetical protein n=1 Tax=Nitrosomonas sp. Is37 TaxID=3080535 RepID=UPI00294B0117|nr:hypothetical protein [Nitrosomonas sp. Is37]MDV6345103.1 hypothetical protein [Nitrosomonas sp. Is37]
MAFVNERKEDGTWQTIDRERNLVLQKVGGGRPQEPTEFNLNISGENVRFYAFQRIKQLESGKDHIEWRVVEIIAPPNLKSDRSKLHPLIEEALNGYGFASSREYVETLIVTFAANL